MKLDEIRSKEELEYCVDMYMSQNDISFLPADRDTSIKNLKKAYRNDFVRVVRDKGVIIAWAWFLRINLPYTDKEFFQQYFYTSNCTGVKAYKCVIMLHEAAEEEAKRLKIRYLISQGSHMDPHCVFAKMLERQGWQRRGHTAVLKLSQGDPRLGRLECVFSR